MRFKIKWETTISIVRPYYKGTETVFAFSENDVKEKAQREIAKKMCMYPGEVVILEVIKA